MSHANAQAVNAVPHAASSTWLELAAVTATYGVAATLQFSIAAAQAMLAVAIVCWLCLVVVRRERIEFPRFFWPIVVFGALTLVSAAFSPQPRTSLADSKQLALFLIVPLAYRLATPARSRMLVTIIVSVAAISALFGIVQYQIFHYDRPHGTLGHYMTYSGLIMLVIGAALARVLFDGQDRIWAALVLPALAVAVTFSSTRNAWVGTSAAVALLFFLKDYRLIGLLPIAVAVFFSLAPAQITDRFMSMFDASNPTRRDRVAMLYEGAQMVRDHPLVGVGPNMVEVRYPEYRRPDAVEEVNPHLHNVPLQIAAERGLPTLAAWLAFVAIVTFDLARLFRSGQRVLTSAALAAVVAMLTAGMFEHNFGDSEFLMLFLMLITLPFAADRASRDATSA
jgi:O-antigen ligase